MPEYNLTVNKQTTTLSVPEDMPLLWILRDELNLTGSKYGCGIGVCGACSIHVDGKVMRSCQVTASECVGKQITTIEGLSADASHPVQQAWIDENVPQCGYCQCGQIMTAAYLLNKHAKPTDAQIDEMMRAVLCRCGTYYRIKKAIKKAAGIT